MSFFDRAKIAAEIAEMGARIYGIVKDKGREAADRDAKIKALEAELAELKRKLEE